MRVESGGERVLGTLGIDGKWMGVVAWWWWWRKKCEECIERRRMKMH
jgi:hypothetical protein